MLDYFILELEKLDKYIRIFKKSVVYNHGARLISNDVPIWLGQDPKKNKYPWSSPYVAFGNNPIIYTDPDGRASILSHYIITKSAMSEIGYSKQVSDIIAHLASTYADGAGGWVIYFWNLGYRGLVKREGIDYQDRSNSQKEANVIWHSMMTDKEKNNGMTEQEAMLRGMSFGWTEIIEATKKGDNKKRAKKFAVGIHALQDGYFHKGVAFSDHIGHNFSSVAYLINDILPDYEAVLITYSAVLVHSVLISNSKTPIENMISYNGGVLDLKGMNETQLNKVKTAFIKAGYRINKIENKDENKFQIEEITKSKDTEKENKNE